MRDWKDWPPVPLGVVRALEEFANSPQHFVGYNPKDPLSAEQALGQLAFIAGMGHLVAKAKVVHKKQMDAVEKTNIPSHVRQD